MDSVLEPSPKVVARLIEDELIIVPIEDGFADLNDALFSLNETGKAVWEKLKAHKTVRDICEELETEFNASFDEIKKDVTDLLTELIRKKLVRKL